MRAPAYVSEGRPLRAYDDGASLLRVLSSPVRLAVLDELSQGERCVHELVDAVHLPQAQVSQHLRVLKDARFVTSRRQGREVVYALADVHAARIVHAALAHGGERR
jgi:DNA-binding transcriptional ArsR family regulator